MHHCSAFACTRVMAAEEMTSRVDDLVGSVAILAAELQSARRQHAALQYLVATSPVDITGGASSQSSPKVRWRGAPQTGEDAAKELAELRERLKEFAVASAEQVRTLRAVDSAAAHHAHAADGASAELQQMPPADAPVQSSTEEEPRRSPVRFGIDRDRSDQGTAGSFADGSTGAANANAPSALVAGNAAINIARAERARAAKLQKQVTELQEERDRLQDQVEALPATTAHGGASTCLVLLAG